MNNKRLIVSYMLLTTNKAVIKYIVFRLNTHKKTRIRHTFDTIDTNLTQVARSYSGNSPTGIS